MSAKKDDPIHLPLMTEVMENEYCLVRVELITNIISTH